MDNIIPKFRRCVIQNFPFIEGDFDALVNYGLMSKIVEYLNKVINQTNETTNNMEIVTNLVTELKNYVDHYFDNLDVQEEINNKLDEMVEDGTLQDIIEAYLDQLLGDVEYIFPKNYVDSSYSQFGDITLIKGFEKVILIDTGLASYKTDIYEFLSRNNVSHIDHLIISHYHNDHIGNVINLINDGYLNATSKVYLAPYCNLLTSNETLMATYNSIVTACTNAGIEAIQPTEGYTLTIDDTFKIKFYNFDANYLNDTSALTLRDYNNASAINIIEHQGKKLLFAGDCYDEPIIHQIQQGVISYSFDFMKICHHGIDSGSVNQEYYARLAPEYAFLPANTGYMINNDLMRSKFISLFRQLKTRIYAQYISVNDTKFITNNNVFNPISGTVLTAGSRIAMGKNIYVDISTNHLNPDGSQDKPFKDLGQALASITCAGNYNFYLADGEYNTAHSGHTKANIPSITDCTISIYGHDEHRDYVKIRDGLALSNCNLLIQNCTIETTSVQSGSINAYNSNIVLQYCDFKGDRNSVSKYDAIYLNSCKLLMRSCTFDYLGWAINGIHSDINAFDSTYTDCNYGIHNTSGSVYVNKVTATNSTPLYETAICRIDYKPEALCNDATSGAVTTLKYPITNYNKLIVESGAIGDGTFASDTIYAFRDGKFALGSTYNARSKTGIITIAVDSTDATKVTVTSPAGEGVRCLIGEFEKVIAY